MVTPKSYENLALIILCSQTSMMSVGSGMMGFTLVVLVGLMSGAGQVEARSPFSLINHWYKVACLPDQLKVEEFPVKVA